jgi:aerobic carbon-monoxide dehydrogenase medium subunit
MRLSRSSSSPSKKTYLLWGPRTAGSISIMIPRPFELHTPTSISEAANLLRELKGAKVLAGGQSLVPLMKLRLISPANLVDIGKIPGLSYIRREEEDGGEKERGARRRRRAAAPGDRLLIGSMTTHHEVAASPSVVGGCRPLSEAAGRIGDRQVRNRGTIGGALCHADPAADVPTAAVAMDAEFRVVGSSRERTIKAKDFFKGVNRTSLHSGEILVEVRVPVLSPRSGGAYVKLARGMNDLATIGVAAAITLGEDGACEQVRLALAGAGPTPVRAARAEEVLTGRAPTDELVAEAADEAAGMSLVVDDIRGSAEYKREMVKVYVRRAVKQSLGRISLG